jgi:phosphohistidine phosphatase
MTHHTLLLLRHGIAQERCPDRADGDRALTSRGRCRTRAVLDRLMERGLRVDRLISSPLVRAFQTAQIAVEAGLADAVETGADLAPGGDPLASLAGWLRPDPGDPRPQRLMLVGHEPDLSLLAARLLGAPAGSLALRKAGLAQLALPLGDSCGEPLGPAVLELLLRPSMLLV